MFGAELFTLTPGLLLKLEHFQSWFLKHIFHVPSFVLGLLLLKMSGLNSIASQIAIKKLLFLGSLITEPNMALTVRNLFESRTESYFDTNITSVGVMLSISEVLVKYDPFRYFESWFNNSTFPIFIYRLEKNCQRYNPSLCDGRMVSVLRLSPRHACCSDLFRK